MVKNKWSYTSTSPNPFMSYRGTTLHNRILLVLVMQDIAKYWVGVLTCECVYPVSPDYTRISKG
jgi:hypothetical protein